MKLYRTLAISGATMALLGSLVGTVFASPVQVVPECPPTLRGLQLSECRLRQKQFLEAAGLQTAEADPAVVVGRVINIFLSVLGILFFGLALYGGYLWMTARGDEKQVEKAKNVIERAATGIVIILGAYAIATFVVQQLVTQTITPP